MTSARRRAALLLLTSIAAGGLTASGVAARLRAADARLGPSIEVVVAERQVPVGKRLDQRHVADMLGLRRIPERFAPPTALTSLPLGGELETAAALAPGDYVTSGALRSHAGGLPGAVPLRRGERVVELGVTGSPALTGAGPGSIVDVVVTADGRGASSAGRSYVALQRVELLGLRSSDGADDAGSLPVLASLRVSARDAVRLIACQAFARELRLLVRPVGDDRRVGAAVVEAGSL